MRLAGTLALGDAGINPEDLIVGSSMLAAANWLADRHHAATPAL